MFQTWMEANKLYNEGKELTYAKFTTCFVHKQDKHEWRPRKNGRSIGRLQYAP